MFVSSTTTGFISASSCLSDWGPQQKFSVVSPAIRGMLESKFGLLSLVVPG